MKRYAKEYDALAHMAMQCCNTGGSEGRVPEGSEMSMMAYTALAFGMDSLSWYTYSDHQETDEFRTTSPTDREGNKRDSYYALQSVNEKINSFGYVYKCFTWQGVMLGGRRQQNAMRQITNNRTLSKMVVEASDTETLKKFEASGDYAIGYMKDRNGNDGFMIANYGSLVDDCTLSCEMQFKDCNKVLIYYDGIKKVIDLSDGLFSMEFAYGEGAFVIPYYGK